ncbi:hypothetical protein DESUT3_16050 [Desulfuromonas versatilis]|uniref:DUF5666 domain-containing protein n=1 Tax=Desulfuromonas versatilis TaxID=2802975 RepID=A0ABN6DX24_9BACT|nr:hypothetical protein [Desulfuromonas versatilis]BCR04536.1 hypothetical protein DESUT3_16050 [Desulfuromonas versatilis]
MKRKRVLSAALISSFVMGVLLMSVDPASAKDDGDRTRFTGLVESMPEGLHGTWIIGGIEVTTSPQTEFDQEEGPLHVGGCAKVDIRAGIVHEIDSEPITDCR